MTGSMWPLLPKRTGFTWGRTISPIPLARKLLGENHIIGGSAGTREEIEVCLQGGVDYIGFGPIYTTGSKDDAGPATGIDFLKQIVQKTPVPVIAFGGIDQTNADQVMTTGAHGIAVISCVCCRENPTNATKELHRILSAA